MTDQYDDIYNAAYQHALNEFPGFHSSRYLSFASAVAELCTGISWGIGPTVRTHATIRKAMLDTGGRSMSAERGLDAFVGGTRPPLWALEDAMELAEETVFGPIGDIHHYCYRVNYCFDDDPEDIRILKEES